MKITKKEFIMMLGGMFLMSAAVYYEMMPNNLVLGSLSGLVLVLVKIIPLPVSTITFVLNMILLVIGYIFIGREFGVKTVLASLMLPMYLRIFEILTPHVESLSGNIVIDLVCFMIVVGAGQAVLFNMNASSGGLDIVAKIMNKYLHIELGKAMSISGMCVALSSALIYDKKAVVLSVLGTYFNGIVLDHFIFGQNLKRRVCIITKYEEEVRQFILHELHSGATFYEATGAYNMQKHREIITIVDKSEYQKLMNYIIKKDPEAFVTVYTVSDMRYRPKVRSF